MSLPPDGDKEVQLQEHRPRDSHSGWTEGWGPVTCAGCGLQVTCHEVALTVLIEITGDVFV